MSSVFDELLANIQIPYFWRAHYEMDGSHIENIPDEIHEKLKRPGTLDRIQPGDSVCITGSSREIANQALILKTLVQEVKRVGGNPFIIPAMGSHGGAVAEGQEGILAGYGITQKEMGCPIKSSMETNVIARSDEGYDIHIDKYADCADKIIVFGRVKAHTDFRGTVESGLCKMIVIGMGKQHGAYQCHALGFHHMAENVYEFASKILSKKDNIIGFATIENAYHDTCRLEAVPGAKILEEEPGLLEYAKSRMGRIPFERADILYVDEAGKNISGAGMDPNVTGRSPILGVSAPYFKRIACLDLTPSSHGNFAGVGNADVTTMRLYQKIDFEQTYPNGITSAEPLSVKIPVVMNSDQNAMKFAIRTSEDIDRVAGPKIVWIKNTLALSDFYISTALVEDAKKIKGLSVEEDPFQIPFDAEGNVDRCMLERTSSDETSMIQ